MLGRLGTCFHSLQLSLTNTLHSSKIHRDLEIQTSHHPTGAEMSGQFGTIAEVSSKHFGSGTGLSRPPANIFFATVGRTEERFNITSYYY